MGQSESWVPAGNSFPTEAQLLSNLIPIDDGQDDNDMLALGRFKIFRFRTEPYEIVMKHVRILTPSSPRAAQYQSAAKAIGGGLQHRNIARIHSVNICKRSSICNEQVAVESYVNYYAIDLQAVIDQRRNNDSRFSASQLWYILNSLSDLANYLAERRMNFGVFQARNIRVSPQGYLKVYLFHCTARNTHFLYNHLVASDSKDIHHYLPAPPQCLGLLHRRGQTMGEGELQGMQVFGIGMIVLEAMLFSPTRRYYLHLEDYNMNFDQQQMSADFKELREVYPESLIRLVEAMTKVDPKTRPKLGDVCSYVRGIRDKISIGGSLRMMEEDDSPKVSYKSKAKQQNLRGILRMLTSNGQEKLQFVPVRLVSRDKKDKNLQYRSLNMSQAATQRKQNRLMLSNATILKTGSRRLELVQLKDSIRMLSSFR